MKTNTAPAPMLVLALVLCQANAVRTWAVEETNSFPRAAAPEDLGYDFVEGKTNKIARVHSVTPVDVYVIYEGERGGRKIPRHALPPELQAKYPFDAAKAAE
jgi:hypothetical protein